MWSDEERKEQINVLELKAALFGIQSLCREFRNCHTLIELESTTAMAYINNMGRTHSVSPLESYCYGERIWLSACHIPEIERRQNGEGLGGNTGVENAMVVFSIGKNGGERASTFKPFKDTFVPSIRPSDCSPSLSKAKTNDLHFIRRKIKL
ncbi:hypothetical protein PoB_000705500 [Plakobranchus ocellatus]|uniref:RNase H type-1 domain-containing protein n=1 Tax=Plakobranchus ocellatus TaxID=259542 RepID=A0AAV3YCX6_9GAST|nr:hypothetical protein PoB_000705500 [Plakobranchus ocellatus]